MEMRTEEREEEVEERMDSYYRRGMGDVARDALQDADGAAQQIHHANHRDALIGQRLAPVFASPLLRVANSGASDQVALTPL
ncbi:hypothetical protein EYF80_027937 [Liparis tanakae]|uniref:Uncharacterized protein n=1 Tax=Liparis tanakae TaxID=230148 RepID=A0A4Z2H8H2_9TELE|nr:hypothetical protein EYF80_027937 [Liparis tanakae]